MSSSFSMSIIPSIFSASNHEANVGEIKTPHKEEQTACNDKTPVGAEADACAEDEVDESETDSCGESEVGKTEPVNLGMHYSGRIGMGSSVSCFVLLCRPVFRFSGSCLGKGPGSEK